MTRLSLRFDLDGGQRLGPGKAALLEAIAATGSIRKAAVSIGMSYRRAWLLLEALNTAFGTPLAETSPSGAALSRKGERVLAIYRQAEVKAAAALKAERAALARLSRRTQP
jgi:molybdate transport system regulatory protein